MAKLTMKSLNALLKKRFNGILTAGSHEENGKCCVRELRACALQVKWSDHPDGDSASPTDQACQVLNDAAWSSDQARTKNCLPLALLSEETAPPGWVNEYALRTVQVIVPLALEDAAAVIPEHAKALRLAAESCKAACDLEAAEKAAWAAGEAAKSAGYDGYAGDAAGAAARYAVAAAGYAARYAGYAGYARYAGYAGYAGDAAVYAVRYAGYAARHAGYAAATAPGDAVLKEGVKILIESHQKKGK